MAIAKLVPVIAGNGATPTANPELERQAAAKAGLVVHGADPLNCETPPSALGSAVTPTARHYRRSHFPIPELDTAAWRLAVTGLVDQPLSLSLHELRRLPSESMVVTLECAGNGRGLV